ncbi:hypothetical protein SUGI_0856880 [Cryptomeria japonica]|nr:hypothetical protein SUGI_0856880 [Cryptomeria japonica]
MEKEGEQYVAGNGNWLQYVAVLVGVQVLLLMIFKRSSWVFSKEERPLRLRPTLSRVISFTSPAIAPLFQSSTLTAHHHHHSDSDSDSDSDSHSLHS